MWAIVVAGGAGRRFGEPKQFAQLAGRPVALWSVDAARSAADGVVLVVPGPKEADWSGDGPARANRVISVPEIPDTGADLVVAGGATRSDSVRAGLAAVPDDADVIVVHDAARPLATSSLFAAVVAAVRREGADAVIPVLPVADTLKRVEGETVRSTVDRDGLVAVQTPQAFVASALRSAHGSAGQATDDAALVENWGGTVRTVPGEPHNLKLTRPEDLLAAEALIGVIEETNR